MQITEHDFQSYEHVRASGITNMWDTQMVENLSGLDRDTILEIMRRYSELSDQYPNIKEAR